MDITKKKILIVVSTGRCGTTKLANLLSHKLENKSFDVHHQISRSRFYNIMGNIFYRIPFLNSEYRKENAYNWLMNKYCLQNNFIITDPLTSMIIPSVYVYSKNVCILHVERKPIKFAKSMFNFSRKKRNSFIAHNFFPFWQPYLFPLENLLSKNILAKYQKVSIKKNLFFEERYQKNVNYTKIQFEDLFTSNLLEKKINAFFKINITFTQSELDAKLNES